MPIATPRHGDHTIASRAKDETDYELMVARAEAERRADHHFGRYHCAGIADGAVAHRTGDPAGLVIRAEHDHVIEEREEARAAHRDYREALVEASKARQAEEARA